MTIFERNAKKIVVMAAIAASFSAIFVRLVEVPPMAIGFYRLTFALPFFIVWTLVRYRTELFSISRKQLLGCMLAGLFLASHFFSWFTAIGHTTVASAVVLGSTHPIVILAVTSLLFKERSNGKAILGIIIALVGAAVITGGDYSFAGEALFGDIMAFLGAVFMALYFLAGRKLRVGINAAVYVLLVFSTCWLIFFLGMLLTETSFTGYTKTDFFYLFVMAMICQIGAHAVFNWCLGHVSPLYISTIETGEAIFASLLAFLIFSEMPSSWQFVGGAVTIGGLLYYNYHEGKPNP